MGYKAEWPRLNTYADVLDGLAADVAAAHEYLNKHLSYDYGDARMFFTIASSNNDTKAAVTDSLTRLSEVVTKSAAELRKTAEMYKVTDDEQEKLLDKTYPSK
jgi:hypothetical protein